VTTQSVLISGAAGGLGRAVTGSFLDAGWRVVAVVRPDGRGAPDLPTGAKPIPADLTDPEAATQAVRAAAGDESAPLRAVVNLVGGFASGAKVAGTPVDEFETMLRLNLRPTYLLTAAALPHLVATGDAAVVCVSAKAALRPFAGAAGYVTAKAAVLAFANAVAVEYADAGVRCNTVLPGTIDTDANRAAQPDADRRHWVAPAAVASTIRFLASPESAPVTGAAVPVHPAA
jgi:NAD(P)-dependent dehydrogenase (short-subunit alcohol dehydrogenase family)